MASVRKRKGTERYVVTYTDPETGKRIQAGSYRLKKDADKERLRVETEIEQGKHIPDSRSTTVKALAELYNEHMQQRLAIGAIGMAHAHAFRTSIAKHLVPVLGEKLIKDITTLDVERWHVKMLETLHPYTARAVVYKAKLVEDYARKRGLTKATSFADFCRELKHSKHPPIKTFSMDDIVKVLAAADKIEPFMQVHTHATMRCFVNIAAFCGLRFGEIAGLTVQNVDFAAKIIKVRHSMSFYDGHKGPKTKAGVRDVPMPDHVAKMIREYIDKEFVENENNLVFLSKWRQEIYPGTMSVSWHRLLRRAGLEGDTSGYRFHALRHFAASWMIESGISLTDVCSLLGHATFDMTMSTYAHPVVGGNRRQQALQSMADRLLQEGEKAA